MINRRGVAADSYLLGAGGSGTTMTLCGIGGLAGGPGSGISSLSLFLPLLPYSHPTFIIIIVFLFNTNTLLT